MGGKNFQWERATGHRARKEWGQNFLINPEIVERSLEWAEISKNCPVVEIGPGRGILTRPMLEKGTDVHAVEIDGILVAHLRENLSAEFPRTFSLLHGDAVVHPLADLPANSQNAFQIVANLPYAISTPWMDAVLNGPLPQKMTLLLQRETAQRFSATPPSRHCGAISIRLAAAYVLRSQLPVPPESFCPVPKVHSTLIHLERSVDPRVFSPFTIAILQHCFRLRRKQLHNTLPLLPVEYPIRQIVGNWFQGLLAGGRPNTVRVEELLLDDWHTLDFALRIWGNSC
jgi:16S rRNA (adenine1518-N6/adenine1519-N6)-dimethyltransferase